MTGDELRHFDAQWVSDLACGENPYQSASLWGAGGDDELALANFRLLSEGAACATNLADLDSIIRTMTKLFCALKKHYSEMFFITVAAKHGNACGIGIDRESSRISLAKALWGNPQAVWGGEAIVNFRLGLEEALILVSDEKRKEFSGGENWMLDVIAAPEVDNEVKKVLTKRKRTKLFVNDALLVPRIPNGAHYRFVRGGWIEQSPSDYILDVQSLTWIGSGPLPEKLDDLLIAWAAAYTSFHGGNEVAIARGGQLLACAGGPSTVEAAQTAVSRATNVHGDLKGASFAADAFFPFTDAPAVLVDAGAVSGVVPSGGRKQEEIEKFFNKKGLKVGFIPGQFRGFCRH